MSHTLHVSDAVSLIKVQTEHTHSNDSSSIHKSITSTEQDEPLAGVEEIEDVMVEDVIGEDDESLEGIGAGFVSSCVLPYFSNLFCRTSSFEGATLFESEVGSLDVLMSGNWLITSPSNVKVHLMEKWSE